MGGQSQREIANLNNPDFTIALGIGIEIETGKKLLAIELRTSYSQLLSEKNNKASGHPVQFARQSVADRID
ncbi:MAG: hypothetical protein IPH75_06425 [bacterium]|nr:hypothetical protein [bacterium]